MLDVSPNTHQPPVDGFTNGPCLGTDQLLGAKMVCVSFSGMESQYCPTMGYRASKRVNWSADPFAYPGTPSLSSDDAITDVGYPCEPYAPVGAVEPESASATGDNAVSCGSTTWGDGRDQCVEVLPRVQVPTLARPHVSMGDVPHRDFVGEIQPESYLAENRYGFVVPTLTCATRQGYTPRDIR